MLVYCITNKQNGKKYVGLTNQGLDIRFKQHIKESLKESSNKTLHRAIRKYGADSFNVDILEKCSTKEILYEREKYWISFFDTLKNGYNSTAGGEGSLGRVISEETREKIKQSQLKRFANLKEREKTSKATKAGMKNWWNNLSDIEKEEWFKACDPTGRITSDETKEKLKKLHLGRKVSKESLLKMKLAQSNRSEEWCNNMSIAKKLNYKPENNPMNNAESREKIRLSKLGRKLITLPDGTRKYIKE